MKLIEPSGKWSWRWLLDEVDIHRCIPNSDGLSGVASSFLAVCNVEFVVVLIVVEDVTLALCPDKGNTN